MGFAVLHIEKGSAGSLAGLGAHISRTKHVPNADPARLEENIYMANFGGGRFMQIDRKEQKKLKERIDKRIEEGYKGQTAIRKDAVKHIDVIMTGSHEEMVAIGKDKNKLHQWLKANLQFAVDKFGADNIVEFALHMDEKTPHIHCVVVPLTADGRLSAKEVVGNNKKLQLYQDDYAKAMAQFELQRGVRGSTAKHEKLSEFYGRMNQTLSTRIEIPSQKIAIPRIAEPPIAPWKHKEWAEGINKAVGDAFKASLNNTAQAVRESAEEQIKTASVQKYKLNNLVVAMQHQVRGLKRQIDELQHPEKYEEQRRKVEEAKRAMEQEKQRRQEQARKQAQEEPRQKRGGFKR